MAEWLCRGLQILVQRFDSASGLQGTNFLILHAFFANLSALFSALGRALRVIPV